MQILRNNFHNLDVQEERSKIETEGVTMEAENGYPHFFSIEENLTTGHQWIIDYVDCHSILNVDEDYDAPVEIEDLVGAPGTKQLQISAKSAGTCIFKMAYAYPWEFEWNDEDSNEYIDAKGIDVVRIPVTVSNWSENFRY